MLYSLGRSRNPRVGGDREGPGSESIVPTDCLLERRDMDTEDWEWSSSVSLRLAFGLRSRSICCSNDSSRMTGGTLRTSIRVSTFVGPIECVTRLGFDMDGLRSVGPGRAAAPEPDPAIACVVELRYSKSAV